MLAATAGLTNAGAQAPKKQAQTRSWGFRFRRGRCHKPPALQLRPRHNTAGVSFLNRHGGEIRRVLELVIEASGHAHRTAGGEIGLCAFLQAAGKLAVAALHRHPCLMIAGAHPGNSISTSKPTNFCQSW